MEKVETEKVGRIFRQGLIDSVKSGVENNKNVFVINYSAVSSIQMDALRKDLRALGAQVYVSKNRIAKLALKDLDCSDLCDSINGQTAFAWSNADSVEISKILVKYAKSIGTLFVKGGLLDGAVLKEKDVQRLSDLPSKDVLRSQLLQVILSPMSRLATILNSKTRDLLSILKQFSEKKEGGN